MTGWPEELIPTHAASERPYSETISTSGGLGYEYDDRRSGKSNVVMVEPALAAVVVE